MANEASREASASDLYRVDEPALIMAAARAIIDEDYVGVLVTIDEDGMPRARPIGVADPKDDWSLWMATRRGSRKTLQIMANPKVALHFGFDDTANNHAESFYASFTGLASVHTDPETISTHGLSEKYRSNWPDYPNDLALIRLSPKRLEVMGKGIWPNESHWQPQGIFLP
ncbi:pyridoxamine 5'-phosphate oxidase family protein [Qipengyuania sp. 6B39]|uniref:pyridoxamine 5'-phosphate oxidase family protein n=1 Tax=Qipengyuania proteolytica TaxID=2867239 RepID=UPI001C899E34|nr:pyridoxamine 5'-phosphate oxidase family protein [Qipengyuania proteolytica]MBX7496989.1 pyridoxamine 5'-phosphate oxidase family protein [Qipengyuania proteolytica]